MEKNESALAAPVAVSVCLLWRGKKSKCVLHIPLVGMDGGQHRRTCVSHFPFFHFSLVDPPSQV